MENKSLSKEDKERLKSEIESLCKDKSSSEVEIISQLWGLVSFFKRTTVAGIVMGAIGVGAAGAMLPLKEVELFLLSVDDVTGITNITRVNGIENIENRDALDRNMVANYVKWRESYFYKTAQTYYDNTMVMSDEEEQIKYDRLWAGDDAPDKKYKDSLSVEITDITAVIDSKNNPSTAVVRFKKIYTLGSQPPKPVRMVATFSYSYDPTAIMKEKDRLANPWNFRASGYNVSEEVAQ